MCVHSFTPVGNGISWRQQKCCPSKIYQSSFHLCTHGHVASLQLATASRGGRGRTPSTWSSSVWWRRTTPSASSAKWCSVRRSTRQRGTWWRMTTLTTSSTSTLLWFCRIYCPVRSSSRPRFVYVCVCMRVCLLCIFPCAVSPPPPKLFLDTDHSEILNLCSV